MWFFILFAAIACNQFVHSGYLNNKGLGSECLYDEDCIIRHSFCKGNKICACKIGYQYDPGSDVCFPKVVDLKCQDDYDCSDIQHSFCDYNKCKCKPNHVPSKDKTACLPSMKVTSVCEEDAQCNTVMNGSYCDPINRRCVCERGFRQDMYRMKCTQKPRLHEPCTNDEDCQDKEENKGAVLCTLNGNQYTCECAEGYEARNGSCYKAGSSQATLSSFAFISLLLITFFI